MAYHPNTVPVFLWVQLTGQGLGVALPLALLLMALAAGALGGIYAVGLVPGAVALELTRSRRPSRPTSGSRENG